MLVLKRLEDAERAGNNIYAVVEGCAVSADGKGTIASPTVPGQVLALLRAYEKAGLGMDKVRQGSSHHDRSRTMFDIKCASQSVSIIVKQSASAAVSSGLFGGCQDCGGL